MKNKQNASYVKNCESADDSGALDNIVIATLGLTKASRAVFILNLRSSRSARIYRRWPKTPVSKV